MGIYCHSVGGSYFYCSDQFGSDDDDCEDWSWNEVNGVRGNLPKGSASDFYCKGIDVYRSAREHYE